MLKERKLRTIRIAAAAAAAAGAESMLIGCCNRDQYSADRGQILRAQIFHREQLQTLVRLDARQSSLMCDEVRDLQSRVAWRKFTRLLVDSFTL